MRSRRNISKRWRHTTQLCGSEPVTNLQVLINTAWWYAGKYAVRSEDVCDAGNASDGIQNSRCFMPLIRVAARRHSDIPMTKVISYRTSSRICCQCVVVREFVAVCSVATCSLLLLLGFSSITNSIQLHRSLVVGISLLKKKKYLGHLRVSFAMPCDDNKL